MPRKARRRPLLTELARRRPELEDAESAIQEGFVRVGGFVNRNPATLVSSDDSIIVGVPRVLRGTLKLRAALDAFRISAEGEVALDAGASVGGFTTALLEAGAARVYAVEVGYGQLLGSLRQDSRVVNLERTNIGDLSEDLVPDVLDFVTLDVGYLALTIAVPQLDVLRFATDANLVALVKPTAELGLGQLPGDPAAVADATARAIEGIERARWDVIDSIESPIRGASGAVEGFIHARRRR
jgi:23S rRNA (cytidine1920-2'-O)/16S rRNA (cytidine1409-2'-O)-methyltransferase